MHHPSLSSSAHVELGVAHIQHVSVEIEPKSQPWQIKKKIMRLKSSFFVVKIICSVFKPSTQNISLFPFNTLLGLVHERLQDGKGFPLLPLLPSMMLGQLWTRCFWRRISAEGSIYRTWEQPMRPAVLGASLILSKELRTWHSHIVLFATDAGCNEISIVSCRFPIWSSTGCDAARATFGFSIIEK